MARRQTFDDGNRLWDQMPGRKVGKTEPPAPDEPRAAAATETKPAPPSTRRRAEPAPDWLTEACREIVEKYAGENPPANFAVEYYPYAGFKNTARFNEERVLLRLTDILKDEPREVQLAAAKVLLARLYKKRCPKKAWAIYQEYLKQDEVDEKAHAVRKERRRVSEARSNGRHYDLEECFQRVNKTYFAGKMVKPELSWSPQKSKRLLGHHDAQINRIVISSYFDSPKTPRYVLDYVMYHEMLHLVFPIERKNGRRIVHPPEFREAEKRYKSYKKAQKWLDRHL